MMKTQTESGKAGKRESGQVRSWRRWVGCWSLVLTLSSFLAFGLLPGAVAQNGHYFPNKLYGDGSGLTNISAGPPATSSQLSSDTRIAAWGDSLTLGATVGIGSISYPESLSAITGYAIYNLGFGGETSTQIKVRQLADTGKLPLPNIIWAGRNNFANTNEVVTDIAAMVAALPHTNYLILSILNGTNELAGSVNYNILTNLNGILRVIYGVHYLDVRTNLVANTNGTAQDAIDKANNIPPASLRFDALHLNNAGYMVVARQIAEQINVLFPTYNTNKLVSTRLVNEMFTSPQAIGVGIPNLGVFSRIAVGTTNFSADAYLSSDNSDKLRFYRSGVAGEYGFEEGALSLGLYDYTNSAFRWRTDNTKLLLNESGGNVGIGKALPAAVLPASIANNASGTWLDLGPTGSTFPTGILIRNVDNTTGLDLTQESPTGNTFIDNLWDSAAARLQFRMRSVGTNIITPLTIAGTGNIAAKIATNGSVTITRVPDGQTAFSASGNGNTFVNGTLTVSNYSVLWGNVGIGVVPSVAFHVRSYSSGPSDASMKLDFGTTNLFTVSSAGGGGNLGRAYMELKDQGVTKIQLFPSGDSYFTGSAAKLGIGTTVPSSSLDVIDQVRMLSGIVTQTWTFWPTTGVSRISLGFLSGADSVTPGTNFGFFNKNTDSLSFWNPNPASNNWTMAGTLTASNVFAAGDVSAFTLTDRSSAPDSLADAYAIVGSIKAIRGRVDHSKLHPKAWGTTGGVPDPSKRDLSMVVSAQSMVIADLVKRLAALEKKK